MLKRHLGQFYTTNVKFILSGFEKFIKGKDVVDPFAGKGDLIYWAEQSGAISACGFDIDTNLLSNKIIINDSFVSIPEAEFIITNPPYLAKNKMKEDQKKVLGNDLDDLYLLAISKIIQSNCDEGILIVPVNFLCADNSSVIRKLFLEKYAISFVKYFHNQVFDDTNYNVIAFHFYKNNISVEKRMLKIQSISLSETYQKDFEVLAEYDYKIGGKEISEIMSCHNDIAAKRLTEKIIKDNSGDCKINAFFCDQDTEKTYLVNSELADKIHNNIIMINCIDTKEAPITAYDISLFDKDCLVSKTTSRTSLYLLTNLSKREQSNLIDCFNKTLGHLREKYNSMFLTNFRDNNRKRLSFDFCYKLLNHCHKKK